MVKYPEEFYDFYKKNLIYPDAKPNACHCALAKLEEMGKLKAVVTQNIDGLHQAAGSKVVYELHGSVHRNYCTECGAKYDADYVLKADGIPVCEKCGGAVRPDVVLYEEGKTIMEIVELSDFSRRTAYRYKEYYDKLKSMGRDENTDKVE